MWRRSCCWGSRPIHHIRASTVCVLWSGRMDQRTKSDETDGGERIEKGNISGWHLLRYLGVTDSRCSCYWIPNTQLSNTISPLWIPQSLLPAVNSYFATRDEREHTNTNLQVPRSHRMKREIIGCIKMIWAPFRWVISCLWPVLSVCFHYITPAS